MDDGKRGWREWGDDYGVVVRDENVGMRTHQAEKFSTSYSVFHTDYDAVTSNHFH